MSAPVASPHSFRGRRLTAAHMRIARQAIEELRNTQPVEGACVGGSLAVGLGTSSSDLDLFVMRAAENQDSWRGVQLAVDGIRVDVEDVPLSQLVKWQENLLEFRDRYSRRRQLPAMSADLDTVCRLISGRDVLPHDALVSLRTRVSRTALRQLLIAFHSSKLANVLADAAGATADGNVPLAMYSSDQALRVAAEAFLAACGDLYMGPKHLFGRLARYDELSELRAQTWELLHGPARGDPATEFLAVATKRCVFAVRLAGAAVIRGWEDGIPAGHGVVSVVQEILRPGAFAVNAFQAPSRFADGIVFPGQASGVAVGVHVCELWWRAVTDAGFDSAVDVPMEGRAAWSTLSEAQLLRPGPQ